MHTNVPEELIIRYLRKQATDAERESLEKWLSESAAHVSLFNEYQFAWQADIGEPEFDAAGALQKLNLEIDRHELRARQRAGAFAWRMAASILLVVALGAGVLYWVRPADGNAPDVWREVATAPGQKQRLRLADGTVVRLNSKSALRFPQSFAEARHREVHLIGEAYFEVARDTSHPFIVHTGELQTQVLGTAFNIRSPGAVVEVTVAEGKVAVSGYAKRFELLPFTKLTYQESDASWRTAGTDLERELAWQKNTLIFDNQPLSEVVRTLSDWFGVSISLENEAIGTCRITGKFMNETLENILKALSYSLDIQYTIENREVLLAGKGCRHEK